MGRALILSFVALLMLGVLPASAAQGAPRRNLAPGPVPQHDEQLSGAELVRPLAQAHKNPTLTSSLVQVGRQTRDRGGAAGLRQAQLTGVDVRDERVRVAIQANGSNVQAVQAAVAQAGGTVEVSAGGQVQALVPPAGLDRVASAPGVQYVQPARRLIPTAITGQEVAVSGATGWRNNGAAGAGVKIAVLDGDFFGYRDRQTAGDLPQGLITKDLCGSDGFENNLDGGHGTAVAEIVYEMAPGAQLYLICAGTLTQMADAVQYMIDNGIKIVNQSRGVFNTSRADGVFVASDPSYLPESLITRAFNSGILWVNSAGNSASTHWAGSFSDTDSDGIHNFTVSDEGNNFTISAGDSVSVFLKWDKWPTTTEDFDLYLADATNGQVLAFSANDQNGSAPPTEDLFYTNTTSATQSVFISIVRFRATSTPAMDLFVEGSLESGPQYVVAAGSLTDFAVSPRALVVGAACSQTPTSIEAYSSRGPTINPSVTGVKPDITGFDGVSSATFGTFTSCTAAQGFFGTSAAAPNVAGAAALVRDSNSSLTTPDLLKSKLKTLVTDAGTSGADTSFGTGHLTLGAGPTLSSTPTCTSTPRITVTSTVASGALNTTVSAAGASNSLLRVVFGSDGRSPVNALLRFSDGRALGTAETLYAPFGSTQPITFTTKRQTAGQAVTVPFAVVDRCQGEWKSFVGAGPSVTGVTAP